MFKNTEIKLVGWPILKQVLNLVDLAYLKDWYHHRVAIVITRVLRLGHI